jgi:transcriptional regulator with XRE-family HTH domain
MTEVPANGRVDVGERLRAIRMLRRQTLKRIAERAGVSESFVSQLERGRSSASVATLQRLADALEIEISDLFASDGLPKPRVLRREAREPVVWGHLGRKMLLTPKQLGTEVYDLRTGDSVHYRSSTPHRVSNPGSYAAEVLFVITPPSY